MNELWKKRRLGWKSVVPAGQRTEDMLYIRWLGRTERHRQLCRMEEHASVSGTKRERYILRSVAKSSKLFHAIRSQPDHSRGGCVPRAERFPRRKESPETIVQIRRCLRKKSYLASNREISISQVRNERLLYVANTREYSRSE